MRALRSLPMRNADHGTAIHGRRFHLIRCFEMRIEAPIGIDAGVENQAKIEAMAQNAVDKIPGLFADLFLAVRVPEHVLAILRNGNIGVHAAAIYAYYRLGQEAGGVDPSWWRPDGRSICRAESGRRRPRPRHSRS